MPGEERKFKRRRMIAFPPTRRRERVIAVSHISTGDGIFATAVIVGSIPIAGGVGVDVGETWPIAVGEELGSGIAVGVGEIFGIAVALTCGGVNVAATAGVLDIIHVGGSGVPPGTGDWGDGLRARSKKRMSSNIATISLNRS